MVAKKTFEQSDKKSNSVWFLILGVAFTNLYFDINSADPFNTPKLIITMVIASWLAGHLINILYRKNFLKNKLEQFTIILSILFIGFLFISTLQSDNFFRAFFGDTQRRNGFISYFAFVIIFLFTVHNLNYNYVLRVYKIALINGFIFSLYGLIQITGNDFVNWNNPYNAIISTVGNPNFASAIMSVFTVIGLSSLRIKQLTLQFKVLALIMSIMCMSGIVLSNSRQGLVSLGFALSFYLTIWLNSISKKLGLLSGCLALSAGILSILGMLQIGPLTYYLYKTSVTIRGYYWEAGLNMFKNNIITGVGSDSYGMYFKEYRSMGYPLNYGFDITSSNAHNVYIQILSTTGIFPALSYLILIIFILISGLILIKNSTPNQKSISLGVVSAWIAFQAQSIISIDNIGISIWGWLLGGTVLALRKSQISDAQDTKLNQYSGKKLLIDPVQPIISGLILIPILYLSYNLHQVEKEMVTIKSITGSISEVQRASLNQNISQLLDNSLADPYYKLEAIFSLYNYGYLEESIIHLKNLIHEDYRNSDAINFLADLEESKGNFSDSIKLREKYSMYDPWNAKNYLALVRLGKKSGNTDLAEFYLNRIYSFAPLSDQAKSARAEINK